MSRTSLLALLVALGTGLSAHSARAADDDIRLNSVGYRPERTKLATVLGTGSGATSVGGASGAGGAGGAGDTWTLINADTNAAVATGNLSAPITDAKLNQTGRIADFSSYKTEGKYYLSVDGVGKSTTFRIAANVYKDAYTTAMLAMYGWRCGAEISIRLDGILWQHRIDHQGDGFLDYWGQKGVHKDGRGGWHDAGDYGKYVVNAGVTVGMFLQAWEQYKSVLAEIPLFIPEHGGALPDFLSEMKWEIDWLFSMQMDDGRVSHKLTATGFEGMVAPEQDGSRRFYAPSGSGVVAHFVAMMAQAYRAFLPYDPDYAQKCLDAAMRSQAWLTANPDEVKPDLGAFSTGGYPTNDAGARVFASAQLWESTGDPALLKDLETRLQGMGTSCVKTNFDYDNIANLGAAAYVRSKRAGRSPDLVRFVGQQFVAQADALTATTGKSLYGRSLDDLRVPYYWGSNGVVVRGCLMLQVANEISPNPAYVDTCSQQIAFLFGRNYNNRSQVTGIGKDPPMNPHHRPSVGDTTVPPWPGLVVGGSQSGTDWVDESANYNVNEVAINWNAALVYALAGFLEKGGSTRTVVLGEPIPDPPQRVIPAPKGGCQVAAGPAAAGALLGATLLGAAALRRRRSRR